MSVLEKVQAMSVSRDVSTIQEDLIAAALMVLDLSMVYNVKVFNSCSYRYGMILQDIINFYCLTDFDECLGEGLGNVCEQGCVNTPGGYDCSSCFDGFELVDNTQCQGIVESSI